jgi:hypothetical protein
VSVPSACASNWPVSVTAYESAGLTRRVSSSDSGAGAGDAEATPVISTSNPTISGPNQSGTVERVGVA